MADKPDVDDDDAEDEAVNLTVHDEAIWILESMWKEIITIFTAEFQRALLDAYPRDGGFIVIPRITWVLVSLMYQRSTHH